MSTSDVHGRYFITPMQILERFLITGSLGPTYTANNKFADFSEDIRKAVVAIFNSYPKQAFEVLHSVCMLKKAPKNPPVLLALAAALSNDETKTAAEGLAFSQIRTGTDQFVLTKLLLDIGRGRGRAFRRQINTLYSSLDGNANGTYFRDKLALQFVKYRNRAGWTHKDLLRVGHYRPTKKNNDLFQWVVGKGPATHPILIGYEAAAMVTTPAEAVELIKGNALLPWEAFPTEVMDDRKVWEHLLPNLGTVALIRNLGRMSKLGVDLTPYLENIVAAAGANHPVSALSAWKVYSNGKGDKGSLVWPVNPAVSAALEAGFYSSFGTLEKSESRILFGLDVSGSMQTSASTVPGMTCREVAAAMIMVAMRQQPYAVVGFSHSLIPLDFKDHWKLSEVMKYLNGIPFGSTNAALPIRHCLNQGISDVDLFAIYTDNETNRSEKPSTVLNQYRHTHNPNAKLAAVSLMGTAFTIADPNDPGQMDFVGFDPTVPSVMISLAETKLV